MDADGVDDESAGARRVSGICQEREGLGIGRECQGGEDKWLLHRMRRSD